MDNQLKHLISLFERFDCMQKEHIQALQTNDARHPNLKRLNFERSQAFEDLKNQLIKVRRHLGKDTNALPVIWECREKYDILKNQNDILMEYLTQYRNRLIQQRRAFNHGKKALKGYGGRAIRPPRLISKPA